MSNHQTCSTGATELQNIVLLAPHLRRFALRSRNPSLTPDSAFFFDSRTHSEALRGLLSFVHRGEERVALVYGDAETGKTLLYRRFLDALEGSVFTRGIILNPTVNVKELLDETLRAIDMTPPSPFDESHRVRDT